METVLIVDVLRLFTHLQRESILLHPPGLGGQLTQRPLCLPLLIIVGTMKMLFDPLINLPSTILTSLANASTKT